MINWVEMMNWRAFDSRRIDFQPGLNFVMGPNGAGKSSILEAVAYALTGEPSTVKERGKLLRDPEMPATIRLSFSVGGEEYVVERVQSARRAEAAQILRLSDRRVLASSHARVTAGVEELMSVSADFLRRIIYMAEGDVFRFLDKPPGEAIDEQLRHVLGLNQLNQFIEALEVAEKQLKARVKALQGLLAELTTLGVQQGADLDERLAATDARKRALWDAIGVARAELVAGQQALKEEQAERAKLESLIRACRGAGIYGELSGHTLAAGAEALTRRLEATREASRAHEVNAARLAGEGQASSRVLDLVATIDATRDQVACPVCGKPMAADECAGIASRLRVEIDAKKGEARQETDLSAQATGEARRIEPLLARFQELSRTRWGNRVLLTFEQAAAAATSELTPLQQKVASLDAQMSELERERAAYLTAQKSLAELGLDSPEQARSTLVALEARSLSIRAALGASQATLAAQRNHDLGAIYEQIAQFWGVFLGEDQWRVELDGRGMPALTNAAGQAFDLSQFSGGEKTALLITLHTIISHHFSRTRFLMIDEPLEHLDPINRRSLIRFLVGAYRGHLFEQAIIATFEESLVRKYMSEEGVNVIHLW